MANKIYALLVGIDNYAPESGVNSLQGCVNDIEAIEEYLRALLKSKKNWALVESSETPWKLTNDFATRQAIINGFRQHLSKADSEDVVLFYYAGDTFPKTDVQNFWNKFCLSTFANCGSLSRWKDFL